MNARKQVSLTKDSNPFITIQVNGEHFLHIGAEEFERTLALINFENQLSLTQNDIINSEDTDNDLLVKYFVEAPHKRVIQLDDNTAKSSGYLDGPRKDVIIRYRDLTRFKRYWLSGNGQLRLELFQALSDDIINTPYTDTPHDFVIKNNRAAYHTNHGTTHGLRQMHYAQQYLTLVKQKGKRNYTELANSLTNEELAAFDLASYLFRSGRTNEASWRTDLTFGERSAQIFKQIAAELGFSEDVIKMVAECFDYHQTGTPENNTDSNEKAAINKVTLFKKMALLSHETDLIRCEQNYTRIAEAIDECLISILREGTDIIATTASFLAYAEKCCEQTGAPICAFPTKTINEGKITILNCTHDISNALNRFKGQRPSCLQAPSKISVDDFCEMYHAQIKLDTIPDVLRFVDIRNREDLDRVSECLLLKTTNWSYDSIESLKHFYLVCKVNPATSVSCTRSLEERITKLTREQHNKLQNKIMLSTSHSRLSAAAIREARRTEGNRSLHTRFSLPSNRKAPTLSWYSNNPEGLKQWQKSDISIMPVDACIKMEQMLLHTHVPAYHATTFMSYAMDLFCQELLASGLLGTTSSVGAISWVRHPYAKPPKNKGMIKSVKQVLVELKHKRQSISLDNSEEMAWHLLSCSPSFWQNTNIASEEATSDYLFNGVSASKKNFRIMFDEILDQIGLLCGQSNSQTIRDALYNEISAAASPEKVGDQGVLYQYLLAHEIVDDIAYISKKNGKHDSENPSALKTLIALQQQNTVIPNRDELQIRLLVPKLLDPEYAKHIVVKNHFCVPSKKEYQIARAKLHEIVRACAQRALAEPTIGYRANDYANHEVKYWDTRKQPVWIKSKGLRLSRPNNDTTQTYSKSLLFANHPIMELLNCAINEENLELIKDIQCKHAKEIAGYEKGTAKEKNIIRRIKERIEQLRKTLAVRMQHDDKFCREEDNNDTPEEDANPILDEMKLF